MIATATKTEKLRALCQPGNVASQDPVQNEICYIHVGEERLLGEVIKIVHHDIFVQCFESTRGMKVGNMVEFTGEMLEITLGPGMLSKIYDGLQSDLKKFDSLFIERGQHSAALDAESLWHFKPLAKKVTLSRLTGGGVRERCQHRILVPLRWRKSS